MKHNRLMAIIATTMALAGCNQKSEMDKVVDALYDRMTDRERLVQLQSTYVNDLFDADGKLDTAACRRLIPNGMGHFSQYASQSPLGANSQRDRVEAVQKWIMENTPSGIPALFHEEVLSGVNTIDATIYPQQIGHACSFNQELAEKKTLQTASALRSIGGVLALSPMVDVCRNPGFNRVEESYGEDAYLSAVLGTAFVKGLQMDNLRKGVAACSKHYLGYGGGGEADEKELLEEILMPHEAMIRLAGNGVVMPGYHAVHGVNCVENTEILRDILRDYVGFEGMVVSDYGSIDQLPETDPVEKAAAALNAGNDVDFPRGDNYRYLPEAIERGLVSEETFENAVKNVLRQKYMSGLLDSEPFLFESGDLKFDTPEERQTAYDIASQSIVLLENNGVLPLRKDEKVLLTGPNANTMWAMCGDYSYPSMSYFWQKRENDGEHPHIVTLLEGMKNTGAQIIYSRGCDWTEEIETLYSQAGDERAWEYGLLHRKVDSGEKADRKEALALAAKADVIVAAVGENVMLCGENRDRMGLRLPGSQEQFVEDMIATGKPVVLVVFGGRAQVISGLAERCAAVIQAWYPGEEGGNAVADILTGKVCPSAKLSVSYPNVETSEPLCYNYSDSLDPRVAWPFGYGLSYTCFAYGDLAMCSKAKTTDKSIEISFNVENTGSVEADEIAEIYISPADGSANIRPVQLQGFARVSLKPGEKKTVRTRLYVEQFGFYTNNGGVRQWNVEPGRYLVKVGASSVDFRLSSEIKLVGKHTAKPLREYYFSESTIVE